MSLLTHCLNNSRIGSFDGLYFIEMRNILHSITHIGVTPDLPFNQQNKIRIFNVACLTVIIICTFFTFLGLYQQRYLGAIAPMSQVVLLIISFFIVHKRNYAFAFHSGLITGLIFLCIYAFLFGERSHTHIYLVFMPVGAIIFFDTKRTIVLYFIVCVLLLTCSKLIFSLFEPVYAYNSLIDIIGWTNYAFVSFLIFMGVKQFKLENTAFNQEINLQRLQLKEKNKDITDSFHYAQRIQKALMASNHLLNKKLPSYFVMYMPKDIVSGDFYWAEESDGRFLLAICDCTGHGVPGAFMSLLNITKLNETVREKKITRPDLVFNQVREDIIKALNPEGTQEEGRDGMDASFCSFDFDNLRLEYACANNPVWVLRNDTLIESRFDKMPVGMYGGPKTDFTLHSLDLQKGDTIYLFTDGYADQFGGPKGKKFKYAQLKETILSIHKSPLKEQQQILHKVIESWKGKLDQVDDILVVGIRI